MATVVGVRFKNAGKLYYFDPGPLWPAAGSYVVVETARGIEYGQVITGVRQVDDDLINSVTDSVTADPANALSYYIGYLEFQELREYAEEELGDAFSAQAFHKAVLDVGEAPFQVVREAVEAYAGGQEKDR